jgi:agmatinase
MTKKIWRELLTEEQNDAEVLVCGISYDGACSCGKGASLAPSKLRELSAYLPPVSYKGEIIKTKVFDFGDIENYQYDENYPIINQIIKSNKFGLFLGGDHSISIPTQKAFIEHYQNKRIGIIHCDAHADLCDIYDDNKLSHACVNRRAVDNGIKDEDITYIGIRSWEKQELVYLDNHQDVRVYPMYEIKDLGIKSIINNIIAKYKNYDAIYLSVDIDISDPSTAPGTGTPEAAGINSYDLLLMVREIIINLPIKVMDVVEVSPPLDNNNITSWLALKLIYEAFYCFNKRISN